MYSNLNSVFFLSLLKKIAYNKGAHQAILGYLFLHIFILFTLAHIFFLTVTPICNYLFCLHSVFFYSYPTSTEWKVPEDIIRLHHGYILLLVYQ